MQLKIKYYKHKGFTGQIQSLQPGIMFFPLKVSLFCFSHTVAIRNFIKQTIQHKKSKTKQPEKHNLENRVSYWI